MVMVELNVKSNGEEVAFKFEKDVFEFPEAIEEFAEDAVGIITEIPRNYMPARHRRQSMQHRLESATGRLWSGWGRRNNIQTINSDSSFVDNIATIEKTGEEVRVQVGTTVPYAGFVDVGAPFEQNRPEYLFTHRGNDLIEKELEKLIQYYTSGLSAEERRSVGPSIRARSRSRDVGGRFI